MANQKSKKSLQTGGQTAVKLSTTYKLDTMIKVDETLCIHCGSCVRACPSGLITAKDFPVPIEKG